MDSSIAVRMKGIKKRYRLGQIGGGTLQGDLQSWWAKKRGKEDPNSKIGSDQRLIGQTFMALNGIDLEIKKGEAIGIIGKNGAGKSTLLKLLSSVTAPTEGTIEINGRITSMLEVGTGFHPEMTGRENVYLNGAILGMTRAEIDKKMSQIIDFSEVGDFIDTPVKRYSSGMYVKLAFSVAAHLDSEIMIMDEVLAVGDMKFQQKCLNKMRDAATVQGKTVLYVSHNMNTIRQLCDRCIVLSEGKIIFDGEVNQAIKHYLNISDVDLPVFFDFSKYAREYHFGKKVFIKSFQFLNKEAASFEIGELINICIKLSSQIDIENAKIVVSIKKENIDQIGMALSNTFCVKKSTDLSLSFAIDLSMLAQGRYCINLEIIEVDDKGNYFSYDNPGARIFLELIGEYAHGIKWYRKYWADVSFPSFYVKG